MFVSVQDQKVLLAAEPCGYATHANSYCSKDRHTNPNDLVEMMQRVDAWHYQYGAFPALGFRKKWKKLENW